MHIEEIINAVKAASAIEEYELAVELLKNAKLDRCFYCGEPGDTQVRKRIGLNSPGQLIAFPVSPGLTPKRLVIMLGWVHNSTCTNHLKWFRPQHAKR